MKKIIYLAIIIMPFVSCVSKKKADGLQAQKDSLNVVVSTKDSLINDVFASLSAIAQNLNQIKSRENIITSSINSGELTKEPTVQINEDIQAINQLLQNNRETIARLERNAASLRRENVKIGPLEKLIAELHTQVAEKDGEIQELKGELSRMNIEVDELNTAVTDLTEEKTQLQGAIKTQGDLLSTAYYIIGSQKELLSGEIIYKSGFIGRTLKINENRSLDSFTQIDTRTFDELLIGRKNVQLISSHPDGSYEFVMDDDGRFMSLVITDKAKFWEYSKVLVISFK